MSAAASARAAATAAQRRAADPAGSAWVVASAGSGKTQVLTNRILRLLLAGTRPESLLCLTYTRAAAANMATRLHRDLAAWARPGATDLPKALGELLGAAPTPHQLAEARRLLAAALDAPGGMRIGTLHSFAQMLLRRFPLEAGVAPHFALLDDADRADLLRDAREGVFAAAAEDAVLGPALDALARRFAPKQFGEVVTALVTGGALPHGRAAMLARLGLPAGTSRAGLVAEAIGGADTAALRVAAQALSAGTETEKARAAAMAAWLAGDDAARAAGWGAWAEVFLKKEGGPRTTLANKPTELAFPGTIAAMQAEAERVADARARLAALGAAEITGALAALAAPIFARFADAKRLRAALDYDDLIGGAETLLAGDDAPWVLFRLDGGLDHLLIDEAQDTAPAQWAIARALTDEFFAGEGARGQARRTVFAVGDPKQSIFSFQGADVAAFDQAAVDFARRAAAAESPFARVDLPVSFRSAQAVLDVVNAVPDTGWPAHTAARAGQAGSVELWPLFQPPDRPEDPSAADAPPEADQVAAETLAATLKEWIGALPMPARGRTLRPGDILVLVRRRKAFVGHLTRALKKAGVAVAGLDRLKLTDSLAVQDCLAFLDCLLLPEDDLTLAAVLKGPFCQLDEDSLMALALDRRGHLIAALNTRRAERADWERAAGLLEHFRGRADFADAHALLAALLDHAAPDAPSARAALIARLGEQAVEPLDELLRAALADSLRHPPSLQGFLHRLRTANAEIRRDADLSAEAVRIMTVHGAKGLQAPLVVLADTMSLPEPPKSLIRLDGVPAWLPPRALRPPALQEAADAARLAAMQEHERLLYVALTRAEERLVVLGWAGRRPTRDEPATWYRRIEAALGRLGAGTVAAGGLGGVLRHATPQQAPADQAGQAARRPRPETLPGWAAPARSEAPGARRIKPSGEDDAPEEPPAAPPFAAEPRAAARLRRGDLTHLLLQVLPTLPEPARAPAAASLLARQAPDLAADLAQAIAAEALGVLAHPDSAALFADDGLAEAPIVGEVDGRPVNGVIDRLVIRPDRVLLVDFKTDRAPPASAAAAPPKYLRQLAIYRLLLARMFPGRDVQAALVWTALPAVMPIPGALLDQAMLTAQS